MHDRHGGADADGQVTDRSPGSEPPSAAPAGPAANIRLMLMHVSPINNSDRSSQAASKPAFAAPTGPAAEMRLMLFNVSPINNSGRSSQATWVEETHRDTEDGEPDIEPVHDHRHARALETTEIDTRTARERELEARLSRALTLIDELADSQERQQRHWLTIFDEKETLIRQLTSQRQ